jgi:2-dehydro-3-deoxyphosphogluconate aldolase/(4S)-4-hydroxy-2-oxoglutarate aldolase
MNVGDFKKQPILGIVRGVNANQIESLINAVIISGLKTLEITMNTANAAKLIRRAKELTKDKLALGAGTVLNMRDLKEALDSGATFIVTPVFVKDVTAYCAKNKIPVFPGALTPAEIYQAWQEGATMVKVFPAKCFGPEYFKEVKGPFQDIELLAVGGITPENIREYFNNGASAVAFGASVFRKDWIEKQEYQKITSSIKDYLKQLN